MPDANLYQLEFKPDTYWNTRNSTLANIKGDLRKKFVLEVLKKGKLEDLSQWMLKEELPDEALRVMGKENPALLGGEYLPCYAAGEVEIARIAMNNHAQDVISVRAKQDSALITYEVVDEYESKYIYDPKSSPSPLSFREIIMLLNSIRDSREPTRAFTNPFRDFAVDADDDSNEVIHFLSISSVFYPFLESWFLEEAAEWHLQRVRN